VKLKGLYAITDSNLISQDSIVQRVSEAILGGAAIIQLREKERSDGELMELASRLCHLCKKQGAIFIVNDRVKLAQKVHAHGVHIGKDDSDLYTARKMLPDKIIGVSCYNSLQRAIEMEEAGADYVAFGSFFPSPTKPQAVKAPLTLLQEARKVLSIPICAIGGITPENAAHVIEAGAHMVAVISSLWKAPDIKEQAQRFARLFEKRSF